MIDTKKIGRPKKLSRSEVLSKAMNVFWMKGYDGASIKDLTAAIGVKGPSLYAEFGDKQGLYLEAIDFYVSNDACAPLIALEGEADIYNAVKLFFCAAIDDSTQGSNSAKGCFLVSCVSTSAGNVEGTQELLKVAIAKTELRIAARFEKEQECGNLSKNFPALQRARLLFDLRQGLVFRARAGLSAAELMLDLEERVQLVLMDHADANAV